MRRSILPALWLVALLGVAVAQDAPAPAAKQFVVRTIVEATARPTKRFFFVVDVSGSMQSSMGQLLGAVQALIAQPLDEFEIAVAVFNDNPARWPGLVEEDDPKPPPPGWGKLPSMNVLNSASTWLRGYPGAGNTKPEAALEIALKERRTEITVVFVTDGQFDGGPAGALKTIRDCQKWRQDNHLGKAIVIAYGVGGGGVDTLQHMRTIGEDGGGFYVAEDAPPAPVEAPAAGNMIQGIAPIGTR